MAKTRKEKERDLSFPITILGETKTMQEWLDAIDLSFSGLQTRISSGYSLEEALTTPKHRGQWVVASKKETGKKETKRVYKFVRNGGGAGTWKWVEE